MQPSDRDVTEVESRFGVTFACLNGSSCDWERGKDRGV